MFFFIMDGQKYFEINLEGTIIPYRVRSSPRARNIRLVFEAGEGLVVSLPRGRRKPEIESMLLKHARWIVRKYHESVERGKMPPPFQLKEGSPLPVLDRVFRLSLKPCDRPKTRWSFERGVLLISGPLLSASLIKRGILDWYKTMARLFLEDRIPARAGAMGVSPRSVRVKNQSTLWGSCSKKRNLNFNWRILLLSEDAAEYLIIHELAHLRELNHSLKFWQIVGTFCPDFKRHKAELREKSSWLKYPPPIE